MPGTEGFLQGREVFLGDKRWSQHWFVAILELKPQGLSSGTPLGSRAGLVVAHANILGIGAGARVYKEFVCGASSKTPCGTRY